MQDQPIPPIAPISPQHPSHQRFFLLVGIFSFLALFLLMTIVLQTKRSYSDQSEAKTKKYIMQPVEKVPSVAPDEVEDEEDLNEALVEVDQMDSGVSTSADSLLEEME